MKKKKRRMNNLIFILLLLIAFTAGCKDQGEIDPETQSSDTFTEITTEKDKDVDQTKTREIEVTSVKELLEAIGPNTVINLEPKEYNLSEYIEEIWEKDGEDFNKNHEYVKLREVHDGVEVVIQNVENMKLRCEKEHMLEVELVIEPRYGAVLNFQNCNNISLLYLEMGHTDTGTCNGNVINFYGCKDIYLDSMVLYGCGDYGIGAYDGTGEVHVNLTSIKECASGPFYLEECVGMIEFWECSLRDSTGGGYYKDNEKSDLHFIRCDFGQQESNIWFFREDVKTEDCSWEKITSYPDVEPEEDEDHSDMEIPEFDYDSLMVLEVDTETMVNTSWIGYMIVDQSNGHTDYLVDESSEDGESSVYLSFFKDGAAEFEINGETIQLQWLCENDGSLYLMGEDYSMYAYVYSGEDDYSRSWLMLQKDGDIIWLY